MKLGQHPERRSQQIKATEVLQAEPSEDARPIDVEKEVGKETLKETFHNLNVWREGSRDSMKNGTHDTNWFMYGKIAAALKFVFPGQVMNLRLDEELRVGLISEIEKRPGAIDSDIPNTAATSYKDLFPERMSELGLNESTWKELERELNSAKKNGEYQFRYAEVLLSIKQLFPERFRKLAIQKYRDYLRKKFLIYRSTYSDEPFPLLFAAYYTKLLFSEMPADCTLTIEEWEAMKTMIHYDGYDIGVLAESFGIELDITDIWKMIKVLAEDGFIDTDGFIKTRPPSTLPKKVPLPERSLS